MSFIQEINAIYFFLGGLLGVVLSLLLTPIHELAHLAVLKLFGARNIEDVRLFPGPKAFTKDSDGALGYVKSGPGGFQFPRFTERVHNRILFLVDIAGDLVVGSFIALVALWFTRVQPSISSALFFVALVHCVTAVREAVRGARLSSQTCEHCECNSQ